MRLTFAFLLAPILILSTQAAEVRSPEAPVWADVNAIFVERCVRCHSAQGAGLGLRLDSYAAAIAGSRNGPVLLPNNPDGSELIRRLRGSSLPRMPFLGSPLPEEDIDLIRRWVDAGLPDGTEALRKPW